MFMFHEFRIPFIVLLIYILAYEWLASIFVDSVIRVVGGEVKYPYGTTQV